MIERLHSPVPCGRFFFLSFVVRSLTLLAAKKGTLGAKGGKLNVQV